MYTRVMRAYPLGLMTLWLARPEVKEVMDSVVPVYIIVYIGGRRTTVYREIFVVNFPSVLLSLVCSDEN